MRTVTRRYFRSDARHGAVGHIIVADGSHHFPARVDDPVILQEGVGPCLVSPAVVQLRVEHEVVQNIGACREYVLIAEGMVIQSAHRVLHVAVAAHVAIAAAVIIRLVVLVERVCHLQSVVFRYAPLAAQSGGEVAVTLRSVGLARKLAEIISGTA